MSVEEITGYRAYCDWGPDKSGHDRCGNMFEGVLGETLFDSDFNLAQEMKDSGWIVECDERGWPVRYAFVICPEHKEKS